MQNQQYIYIYIFFWCTLSKYRVHRNIQKCLKTLRPIEEKFFKIISTRLLYTKFNGLLGCSVEQFLQKLGARCRNCARTRDTQKYLITLGPMEGNSLKLLLRSSLYIKFNEICACYLDDQQNSLFQKMGVHCRNVLLTRIYKRIIHQKKNNDIQYL